jgi:hypothetical protein
MKFLKIMNQFSKFMNQFQKNEQIKNHEPFFELFEQKN